jgi:sugar (pentulose or hexulose) kinase
MADTGVVLDSDGAPVYPIIAWYDQRCTQQVHWLSKQIDSNTFHAITGQRFSTSLGISKWLWLKANLPDAIKPGINFLSISDYILWRLTGKMVTDYSMASRMGLLDQRNLDWSEVMLQITGLSTGQLPRIFPSGTIIGDLLPTVAEQIGLPGGLPCILGGHDHLCAAAAVGAENTGTLVDSCGTAQSLLVAMDQYRPDERLVKSGYVMYAHVLPGRYVLRGGLRSAGGAIQWLAENLAGKSFNGPLPYAELMDEASQGVGLRAGPIWLPHLMGSGTPQDDPCSLAAVIGLKYDHNRGDIFRGLLESLAFWLRQNLEQIELLIDHPISEVLLVSGTTRLELLSQLKADVLNRPMIIWKIDQPSALGAALLAGIGVAIYKNLSEASSSIQCERRVIQPDPERVLWYARLYSQGYKPIYTALKELNRNLSALSDEYFNIPEMEES